MYQRLKTTFTKLNIDYEIIFVNDCSPDDTRRGHPRYLTATTGRARHLPFAKFRLPGGLPQRHGDRDKNACVLLDGDLQDPPELIEQFVAQVAGGL